MHLIINCILEKKFITSVYWLSIYYNITSIKLNVLFLFSNIRHNYFKNRFICILEYSYPIINFLNINAGYNVFGR